MCRRNHANPVANLMQSCYNTKNIYSLASLPVRKGYAMEQIIKANDGILRILGKPKTGESGYRMIHYCITTQVDEGVLVFNTLTRELLLLTTEEYANVLELPYLRQQWFVVPEQTDEKKLVGAVRWIKKTMERPSGRIKNYTILTTTDCNARCFYCYEMGRPRVPMSEETALKVAAFIRDNAGGKPVQLHWFGGEPLYNYGVIDLICRKLREYGVAFDSYMISNGYLFDDEMIQRAVNNWNLKRVQITLDGTEQVYNRCKAFVYREGSAYQIVTGNIERLLNHGIRIAVRMNMDFHNADDLMVLSQELADRFGDKKGFYAYCHLIFDENTAWDQRYSTEKWNELYTLRYRLEAKLKEVGISSSKKSRLQRDLPRFQCMADNSGSIVITPDGHLGACEHFSDSELIGHVDSPERDRAMIESFRQRCDEIPECDTCFYYPECIRLKKCPDLSPCIEQERNITQMRTRRDMVNEYQLWRSGTADAEDLEESD